MADIEGTLGDIAKMAVTKEEPPSTEDILEGAISKPEAGEHTAGGDLPVAAAEHDAARDAEFDTREAPRDVVLAKRDVILRHLAEANAELVSLTPFRSPTTSTSAMPAVQTTSSMVAAAPTPVATDQLPAGTTKTATIIVTATLSLAPDSLRLRSH